MKWMQFFTPVSSINWDEANDLISTNPKGDVVFLDVRQHGEYENGHLPGAKLIPVGELDKRLSELQKDTTLVVYCAIGGRSRVASQLLAGKGFSKVYNLSGGIKAWEKEIAIGPEDSGMHLFSRDATPEDVVVTGFGLEMGLRDFYLSMKNQVQSEDAKGIFDELADIEIIHQKQLVELYVSLTGNAVTLEDFQQKIVKPAMEGGLTTDQYLQRYDLDKESDLEVLSLAMSIEVQALDLYLRAAEVSKVSKTRDTLLQIAEDERGHINLLGQHIDQQQEML